MPQLLREYYELCEGGVCQDLLTEAEKRFVSEGGMMLTGKLQEADCQNGNGRVYPHAIMEREVKKYKALVDDHRALGELDHPDSSIINLVNVSHMVTEVWMDGPSVMGKIKVLGTPSGQILKALVESGVKTGISSRGMGSVTERQGKTMVEDDFQLICFDIVSEPSTPNAFMALSEGKLTNEKVAKTNKIVGLINEILEKQDAYIAK
jgi:hypothetical protein|tara:strand:- start:55 stop:675 length:621 start_codon:yes stop_codon:yes gene_type:complete